VNNIIIRQANGDDIPIIEGILLSTVNWLNEMGQPLWATEDVTWENLSKSYRIGDFYIAYADGNPSGCMTLMDYDPYFWPDVKKGESLFIHKLAVTKTARKSGVADALIGFFKEQGAERGAGSLRLDVHALRPKLRAFYERHGFVCVDEKTYCDIHNVPKFHTAFYVFTMPNTAHCSLF